MDSQTDYFKTFCKISKAFGTTLDKDRILDMIVSGAIDGLGAKAACLFLADEDKGLSVPVAQKGLSKGYLHKEPMKIEKAVQDLMEAGGHLYFKDAAGDPRLDNHAAKKAEGIASILVVPVMAESKGIGVLSLYAAEQREFTENEIAFLSALAEQGGIAVHTARLFERINQNADLFFNLSANINSSKKINEIFRILTAEIANAFGMKGVTVRLYNPENRLMDLVASHGLSDAFINKGPVSAEKSRVVADLLSGETVIIEDVATDPRIQYRKESQAEGIVSALGVPIHAREKVIGELRLYSGRKRRFPESLVKLITSLAHQGGIAIENDRLIKRIRMNTEIFHDLAVAMDSTLDVKKIMHILSADMADVFDVKGVSIRLMDEDRKTLQLVASYGLSERYLSKGTVYAESAITEALKNRAVAVRDTLKDDGVAYRDEKKEEGIASILTVPINARDDIIGVMRLYSETHRDFSEDEVMLAMALAHQGGLAIQNASMYLNLQQDKKDLEQEIWTHRSWF